VRSVAEALDIRPMILSPWRKEYRKEKFVLKLIKRAPAEAKKKVSEQEENSILKSFKFFRTRTEKDRSGSSKNTNENTA
jgi:transposase